MFSVSTDLLVFTNLVILIWGLIDLYRGYKRGFLLQLLDSVTTLVALFVAWLFSSPFASAFPWFYSSSGVGITSIDAAIAQQVNRMAWIVIIFIVIRLVLMVLSPIASLVSKMPLIKQVNSSIGGVASIFFFGIKLVLLCLFLTFPVVKNGQQVIDNSVLKYVEQFSVPVFEMIDQTVSSNIGIQNILNHKELSPEQQEEVVAWLRSLNFSTSEIMEYLNSYE